MWSTPSVVEFLDCATEEQAFVLTNFEEKLEITWLTYEMYLEYKHYASARAYFDRFMHILYILAQYLEENQIDVALERFRAPYAMVWDNKGYI